MRHELDTGNGFPRDLHSWEYMVSYGEGPRHKPDMRSDLWKPVQAARCDLVPVLVPGQYQRWFPWEKREIEEIIMSKPIPPVLIDPYTNEYKYKARILPAEYYWDMMADYEQEQSEYDDYMEAKREDRKINDFA